MYCPNCGTQNENDSYACRLCGATIAAGHEYAGYWRRYGAYLLDMVIIYLCILVGLIAELILIVVLTLGSGNSRSNPVAGLISLLYFPACFLFVILYFAYFESSGSQGSPGKMAVGMKVVDMGGNRISFGKALVRQLLKIVSVLILGIGFFMCGFTEKRQGLHDMVVGTLVVMKKPVYFVEPRPGPGSRPVDDSTPVHVIS
jgi:uncharacterized RDD family membrane protein YckC